MLGRLTFVYIPWCIVNFTLRIFLSQMRTWFAQFQPGFTNDVLPSVHKWKGPKMVSGLNDECSPLTPVPSWRWWCNDLCGLIYRLDWGSLKWKYQQGKVSIWLHIDVEKNKKETDCILNYVKSQFYLKQYGGWIINKWLKCSRMWYKKHG